MEERKALIIGVSGMVGRSLADSLMEEGWKVYGAARFSREGSMDEVRDSGIEPFRYDVTRDDPAQLPEPVDVLFLEIWDPETPELHWDINFYGVGRVVERYAGKADIVNGCTINVYGSSPEPSSEETPCTPDIDYGRSRYAQERLIDYFCMRSGRKGIHVRYARANSADDGMVRRTAEKILKGESLGSAPDQYVQVIGLEDFVRVTRLAVDRMACPPALVNCCHTKVWTMRELAEEIHRKLGKGEVVFDRESGGVESSYYANVDRMLDWFGPPRVSTDTIIDRVVEYLEKAS